MAPRYLRGRLIDIGCGIKPYTEMIAPLVSEHIGVDHEGSRHGRAKVDLTGTEYSIPLPDASFDSALGAAVLEHLKEPEQAICECWRVLKPGGVAICSVPFVWHLHEEPGDFFRYAKYGLRRLFEKCDREILEIRALSEFWVTFGQLFVHYIYTFNRGPMRWIPIIPVLSLLTQGVCYVPDRLHRTEQWTWMQMIAARKKPARTDGRHDPSTRT